MVDARPGGVHKQALLIVTAIFDFFILFEFVR